MAGSAKAAVKVRAPLIGFMGFLGIADTSFIAPIISAYAISLGAQPLEASIIAALYSLVAIPSSFFSGLLVDRLGRRAALIIGLISDVAVMLLYAYSPNYIVLGAARLIHAAADSLIIPSIIATIGDLYSGRLGKPVGIFWTFIALGLIIGSGSASIIVNILGFRWVFLTLLLFMVLGVFTSIRMWPSTGRAAGVHRSITTLSKNLPTLLSAILPMLSTYMIIGAIVGSLAPALISYYGWGERSAAAQVGLYMVMSVSISIPFFYLSASMSEKRGPLTSLIIGSAAAASASLILSSGLGILQRTLSSILFGVALGFIYVGSTILVASLPSEGRGAGAGSHQAISLIGVALGAPLSGTLLQTHGLQAPFTATAIPALITLTYLTTRKTKKQPTPNQQTGAVV